MRKFITGLIIGLTIAFASMAVANPGTIKLIINGQEIQTDVPPQNIDGRVMVPARYVAESLGATVSWDGVNNAVVINSNNGTISPQNGMMEEKGESDEMVSNSTIAETTYKGLPAIKVGGETYFNAKKYSDMFYEAKTFGYNPTTNMVTLNKDDEILAEIPNISENVTVYQGRTYIHIKFYE